MTTAWMIEPQASTVERVYRIGELAARFSVSEQSIRNWAANGVLPPPKRTPAGHRRFGDEHVRALVAYLGPV